ncbi:MAG: hypothetical protein CM15mV29_1080 [uncultured marine virus]|nr:MAG: hypothetical protein CM15mV29_1080 [uncultured marine virus]
MKYLKPLALKKFGLINVRWLSVPSMGYDSTDGFYPVGSAQSLSGQNFILMPTVEIPALLGGFNAGELDLRWLTNEFSWSNSVVVLSCTIRTSVVFSRQLVKAKLLGKVSQVGRN